MNGMFVGAFCYADDVTLMALCRANSFKRSISHVEFNKSHVILTNDVQFSKSTIDLLNLQVLFEINMSFGEFY